MMRVSIFIIHHTAMLRCGWQSERSRLNMVWRKIVSTFGAQHIQLSQFEPWVCFLIAAVLSQHGETQADYGFQPQAEDAVAGHPNVWRRPSANIVADLCRVTDMKLVTKLLKAI